MKDNLSFYSRRTDSHRHPKFKMLRQLYGGGSEGWAAEGRFWALNDIIAESEMCRLDVTIPRNKANISETLGLGLSDFDRFVDVLLSTDVELLFEIEPGIYSTKKVQERLDAVLVEREKSRKRKGNAEKSKSSGELNESSGEPNNKVKESKVQESTVQKSKVQENHFFCQSLKDLFKSKTKIKEPNFQTHLTPILELFQTIPEHLTETDIRNSIEETFNSLNPDINIRMDFLTANIASKIVSKHEAILNKIKQPLLEEARDARIQSAKDQREQAAQIAEEKTKELTELFNKNVEFFSAKEKVDIRKALMKNDWVYASSIINAKIEESAPFEI